MTTRTLTVLFTDMVDSTSLLARLSEHEAERLRGAHFAELRRAIERRRGHLVKTLGDGVMATFGAARDAIEAAIALQVASAEAGIRIRIGLSSGDVSEQHGDCFGLPVVEASRLSASARAGRVLVAESTRLLARTYGPVADLGEVSLKGLPEPTRVWEATWSAAASAPVRVVLADDSVLLREGIARVLAERGIEILGQAGDAQELLHMTADLAPDLAIVDVRMPPTWTEEGVVAAETILDRHPGTCVLILSQEIEPRYAERLLDASSEGVGYLLKERVADVRDFADAVRRVASGGIAFEACLVERVGIEAH